MSWNVIGVRSGPIIFTNRSALMGRINFMNGLEFSTSYLRFSKVFCQVPTNGMNFSFFFVSWHFILMLEIDFCLLASGFTFATKVTLASIFYESRKISISGKVQSLTHVDVERKTFSLSLF